MESSSHATCPRGSWAGMVVNEALAAFRRMGLRPKKTFGQNFLADQRIAASVAALATEPAGGTVVEIGAGLGALTAPLLVRAFSVIAIERDRDLCPLLLEAFALPIAEGKLTILEDDAKQIDLGSLFAAGPRPHVLAGNLPYQITGPLLERTTALGSRIDRAVFMVQREVADRLIAPPGGDAYGALTVFVSAAFRVERAMRVSRGAFRPVPNVDSAVVTLTPLSPPRAAETEAFRAAVHAAFQKRRKMLRNAWASLGPPDEIARKADAAGIDLDRRGETLSVEEFAGFAEA
jgi:16S rRNA (adenine1518-N6/adenine1519-N6)-dimethyltransferase